MDHWLDFAQGPLLRFALWVMFLGLARHVFLAAWGLGEAVRKAGDQAIPYRAVLRRTVSWMFPVLHLHRNRALNSFTSFTFHVGLILAPVFLADHIDLWRQGVGIGWPALPRPVADVLTLLTLAAGIVLLLYRIYAREARFISGALDYFLLGLLLIPFATGYVAWRSWNPFSYQAVMLIHVLSGVMIFLLIPFTKLAHCILFPLVRLCSEVAWHFPAGAGAKVVKTLSGTESRPV
jgi:nitrate reductase gamma subunit